MLDFTRILQLFEGSESAFRVGLSINHNGPVDHVQINAGHAQSSERGITMLFYVFFFAVIREDLAADDDLLAHLG